MRKKVLVITLILCMLISAITGCSSKSENTGNNDTSDTGSDTSSEAASNEETYDAVMVYLVASDSHDSDKVSEKFNELTKKVEKQKQSLLDWEQAIDHL